MSAEVNEDGDLITYEEYHPYGTAAWRAEDSSITTSLKRYRYSGMERDDETGLAMHGVRFYAPWLGRWCSSDPRKELNWHRTNPRLASTGALSQMYEHNAEGDELAPSRGLDETGADEGRYEYAQSAPTLYVDQDGLKATAANGMTRSAVMKLIRSGNSKLQINPIGASGHSRMPEEVPGFEREILSLLKQLSKTQVGLDLLERWTPSLGPMGRSPWLIHAWVFRSSRNSVTDPDPRI